jgi:hypothetical protein
MLLYLGFEWRFFCLYFLNKILKIHSKTYFVVNAKLQITAFQEQNQCHRKREAFIFGAGKVF